MCWVDSEATVTTNTTQSPSGNATSNYTEAHRMARPTLPTMADIGRFSLVELPKIGGVGRLKNDDLWDPPKGFAVPQVGARPQPQPQYTIQRANPATAYLPSSLNAFNAIKIGR